MAEARQEIQGNQLKRERESHKWTQGELATKINGSERSIRRWEKYGAMLRQDIVDLLTKLFGKPPEEWGNTNPRWNNVPFSRNRYFTGREQLLERLHQALASEQTVALTQPRALSGLGGIGKTATVIEYTHRYADEYEAVLWVRADAETLVSDFAGLAAVLELPERHERDQVRAIQAVKRWLNSHDSWLLIFDNADHPALITDFLPGQGRGAVLLTTRAQATDPHKKIELEKMSREEGTSFLLRRLHADEEQWPASTGIDTQEQAEAGQICEYVDGLPLALDQAAAYMKETGCTLSDYLDVFDTNRKDLLEQRGERASDHPESVARTWEMALEKVEKANPAAAELLRFCAFLQPDAIPEDIMIKGADALGPALRDTAIDTFKRNNAIGALLRYSLVKRVSKKRILTIHRLVQAVIQDSMNQKAVREWAERVVRAVSAAFPDPEPDTWPQCESLLPHAKLAAHYIEAYDFIREEAGHLLYKMAFYLQDRARYVDAEPLFRRALHIREQQLGGEHPQVAIALTGLAELSRKQGTYELAEPLFQRALRIWEQQRGPEPSEMAVALTGLGRLYYEQGKYELAEPLYSQAHSIREQRLGPVHPQVAIALKGLGELYRKQGRYEQAMVLFQRALRIWEQQRGPEPAEVADPLNNLAALYYEQGKYTKAEPLFQRALHIWEQRLGLDHPQVAIALNNLAWLYRQLGKYEQAESLYQRAFHIWEQHLGPEHYQVAYPLNNLAELYLEQGRYAEAGPLFQRALSIFEQRLGSEHSQMAYPLNGLAKLHHAQGEYAEAEPLYRRALSIRERQLGPDHPQIAFPLNNLALLYAEQGKYTEAEPLYSQALSIREQALGSQHPETAETIHDLARFWEMQGSSEKARAEYARALAIREQTLGTHHPRTTETRLCLVALLRNLERHEEAARLEAVQAEP